jgi:hypothetical protein
VLTAVVSRCVSSSSSVRASSRPVVHGRLELGEPGLGDVAQASDQQLGGVTALVGDPTVELADAPGQRLQQVRRRARAVAGERLDPLAQRIDGVLEDRQPGLQCSPGVLEGALRASGHLGVAGEGRADGAADLLRDPVHACADGLRQLLGELVDPVAGAGRHLLQALAELARQAGQAVADVVHTAADAVDAGRELGDAAHESAGLAAAGRDGAGEPAAESVQVAAHGPRLGAQGAQFGPYRADLGSQRPDERDHGSACVLRVVVRCRSQLLYPARQRVGVISGAHDSLPASR